MVSLGKPITPIIAEPNEILGYVHQSASTFLLRVAGGKTRMLVNNKKQREVDLVPGDQILLGESIYFFCYIQPPQATTGTSKNSQELFKKLVTFSEKLVEIRSPRDVLETLVDLLIESTHAQKGFVLISGNPDSRVLVARNITQAPLKSPENAHSDSIVQTVLKNGIPILLGDALQDTQFNSSHYVLSLRLSSVLCVPLWESQQVIGVIYLGTEGIRDLFDENSVEFVTVLAAHASLLLQNANKLAELQGDNESLKTALDTKKFGQIIGSSPNMAKIFKTIERVAPTDVSILIQGDTGTGKELIARELHRRSERAAGKFVAINCGAIPENLLESELFGHIKGAFTGAVATRPGKFQLANGGTLFLDEIGEMPPALQVKLLRALQEREVCPVGDEKAVNVDIRLISATHKNLEDAISQGTFREDLYYRLNVVNILLPSLRERTEDIPLLARYLLRKVLNEYGLGPQEFTTQATIAMKSYHWPGNIRELENRIRKATVLSDNAFLHPEDLGLTHESLVPIKSLSMAKDNFAHQYITDALARFNGNKTQAAKALGVDPRTIFRFLEKQTNTATKET